jgi:hypothetical protein
MRVISNKPKVLMSCADGVPNAQHGHEGGLLESTALEIRLRPFQLVVARHAVYCFI